MMFAPRYTVWHCGYLKGGREMSKQTFEDVFIEITFRENAGDMNAAEMLRAYATLLAEKENNGITHWDGTTHYAGCIQAGPKHYECALQEIGRLRLTITHLRAELEKKTWFSAYEKKPWVGLTDIEAADCWSTSAVTTWENFEAKLKDKNT